MHVTELVSREVSYPAIYKCLYWLLRQMDDITKRPQNNNYWSDLQPAAAQQPAAVVVWTTQKGCCWILYCKMQIVEALHM